jgi:processive 1,2-diacylglycerol beta-glucosyltransferase
MSFFMCEIILKDAELLSSRQSPFNTKAGKSRSSCEIGRKRVYVMSTVMREKILILSGDFGEGHQQAALAIKQAIQKKYPQMETKLIDFMKWAHPYTHSISRFLFLQTVKKAPFVYGYLFQKTKDHNSFISEAFNHLSLRKMQQLMEQIAPSVVVCTFPLAAAAMSLLKKYGLTAVPMITVITDHTDHSYWIHPCTNHYIVGSEQVQQALRSRGISDHQITVTGIPVKTEFSETYSRGLLRKKHGLDPNIFTALVMGGGLGIMGAGGLDMQTLENLPDPIQIVILCGHNEKLKEQLSQQLNHSKHQIIVKGYVDHVYEFMAAADLLITKPGGLTTSEAIAMELPMLLCKPLPGQERDNANFLVQQQLAVFSEEESNLKSELLELIQNPLALKKMRQNAAQFHTKEAAYKAIDVIMGVKQNLRGRWRRAPVQPNYLLEILLK